MKPADYTIYPVSENMLTISWGNVVETEINQQVYHAYHLLTQHRSAYWLDIIPAYSTLSIVYDTQAVRENHTSAFSWIVEEVNRILDQPANSSRQPYRKVNIPVCYDQAFALDRESITVQLNMSWDEVVNLHCQGTYRVFMIGFLPGFAYMGSVNARIVLPRLSKPRKQVASGSVGIAGVQTGIYPLDSPGGWNIIGKTPVRMFDVNRKEPVLLRPNDSVMFYAISHEEFVSFDVENFDPVTR